MSDRAAHLVLMRHGHIADNSLGPFARLIGRTDVGLSRRGRWQAERLVRFMASTTAAGPPVALYTSPLRRAVETAALFTSAFALVPRVVDGLAEIDCGELDGRAITEVQQERPALWAANERQDDPHFRWPRGESYAEFRARVVTALDGIAERHPAGVVWVIAHAGVVNQAVGALTGANPAEWARCRPHNAGITRVLWGPGAAGRVLEFDRRALSAEPDPPSG